MTAPAINPAMNALPGLAGGGNGQAAMGGALAGFEALLAALFGDTDIAGVASAQGVQGAGAQTPAAPANALFAPIGESAPDAASPDGAEPALTDTEAAQADAEAVLNPLLMAQVAPPATPPADATADAAKGGDATPPAWGQDKAQGAPAEPALAHADPHAQLAEKAADGDAETSAAPAATQAAKAQIPADTQRAAASVTPPAATDAQAAAQAAAKVAVPPAEPETPAPETPAVATSQAAQAAEITRAADAPPPPPAAPKRKERSAEAVRTEPGAEAAAPKAEGAAGRMPVAAAPTAGDAKADAAAKGPGFKPALAETEAPDAGSTADASTGVSETRSTHASGGQAPAGAHPVRGAPETVANLAAQIVKKLDGRSTRFDVELDPIGLGKVDVRVEIGAQGRMTAAMTFETPQAAAELKSRAGELQRALEQAGFDLAGGGMSFDVAGGGGHGRQEWSQDQGGGFRGRAFQQALETAGEADLAAASGELRLRRGVTGGVDVRI